MSLFSGHSPRIRILTDSAVPSQFCWTTVPSPCIEKRGERATRRARKRIFEDCQAEQLFQENEQCEEIVFLQSDEMELNTGNYEEVDGNIPDESINVDKSVQASVECTSKTIQTDDCAVQVKVVVQATSVDAFIDDPEDMHFHTGLQSVHIFNGVLAAKCPTTRAIFDGTECPIKKPAATAAQQSTFSTYKNRNTVKVLVGVSPAGHVSYVSPAYGGSTSDRQIVERSNLTKIVDQGDSIMADKGFDVQDIFAPLDVTVNIPTFFRKKNKMSGETVLRDRKISSKRVHVERIIGLAKTYKILKNPMNHTESLLASEIIFICFMLTNFRKCIVPRNA